RDRNRIRSSRLCLPHQVTSRYFHAFPTRRSSDLAEFTENIINGVERPVKAAELFAFTLRVRAGNTDVLTDAEENVNNSAALTGQIGRAVQQECRDRSRMPSSA